MFLLVKLIVGFLLNLAFFVVVVVDEFVEVIFICKFLEMERSLDGLSQVVKVVAVEQESLKVYEFFVCLVVLEGNDWNAIV